MRSTAALEIECDGKQFDTLPVTAASLRLRVSTATCKDVEEIYPSVRATLGEAMASLEMSQTVRAAHSNNILAIRRISDDRLVGVYAMVMLTEAGHRALLEGRFDALHLKPEQLAADDDPVAAVYKWAVYAPGRAAAAIPLIARMLGNEPYRRAPLYGVGATVAGRRMMEAVGFAPVAAGSSLSRGSSLSLFRYSRLASAARPE